MGRILPILLATLTGIILIGMIASNFTLRRGMAEPTPDQAFLSTITIELIPESFPPTPTPVPTPLPGWTPGNVAHEASQSLLFSLQRTVDTAIWGLIFIPLILLYLLPVLLVIWLIRRSWKRYRAPDKGLP